MTTTHTPRSIDASLARGIRRGYFRRLAREWQAYHQRRQRAACRNVTLSAPVETRRQFRQRLELLEKFVGPLLPSCTLRIESGTRGAAVVWALQPEAIPTPAHLDSHAGLRALVLQDQRGGPALDALHLELQGQQRRVAFHHRTDEPELGQARDRQAGGLLLAGPRFRPRHG